MGISSGTALLVTEEISGLNKSGGIGACALGLALHLTAMGHEVDILVTDMAASQADKFKFQEAYPNLAIRLLSEQVAEDEEVTSPGDPIAKAYCVYRFVKRISPDVVHFNDWLGSGFYCAMARRQGSLRSRVVTHLHGSSEWVRRYNRHIPSLEDFEVEGIERSQIENSDIVVSPSQYLLNWYVEQNVALPEAKVINWLLPQWFNPSFNGALPLRTIGVEPGKIDTLIFFGRHERRKGFELFLEAVSRFPEDFQPNIIFMGRFDRIDREFTGSLALRKLKGYGGEIQFISDLDQKEALSFLKRRKTALCIIPSLIENSPCVVGECFTLGIPFVANDVGGIAELFEDSSVPSLSKPTGKDLSDTILSIHREGLPPVVSTLTRDAIVATWEELHDELFSTTNDEPSEDQALPLVTVCVTHYERPKFLELALKHLAVQTYQNIEIVIVDDGSVSTAAVNALARIGKSKFPFPLRIVRTANNYLGAARNAAAKVANGEFLLFHDDDNVAEPHEVEAFVSAALKSGSDILTCQSYVFRANDARGPFADPKKERSIEFYPIGIGGVFSFFRNRFGDANALIKRTVFEQVGGFTELRGVGVEDWEFFLNAHIKGFKTGIVPEPLFHYRVSTNGMLATGDALSYQERIYSAVDHARPVLVGDVLRFANANNLAQAVLDQTWYRLDKELGAKLHHELVALDPNSADARKKLSDLAFELGRVKDAIQLAMPIYDQREKLISLSNLLGINTSANDQQAAAIKVSTGDELDGYFLQGWLIDQDGKPDAPDGIIIHDQHYVLRSAKRYDRPDVKEAFELPSAVGLGITAIVQKDKMSKVGLKFGLKPKRRVKINGIGDATLVNRSGKLRGFIDEAIGFTTVKVSVPEGRHWSGKLELLAPENVKAAVNWGGGVFDYGSRYGSNQITFTIPDGATLPIEIEIALPSEKTVDVIFH